MSSRKALIALLLFGVVILSAFVLYACNGNPNTRNTASSAVTSSEATGSQQLLSEFGPEYLKQLDDENNPYRTQYEKWDEWIYNNVKWAPIDIGLYAEYPENYHQFDAYVDHSGYLVPRLVSKRNAEEARANSIRDSNLNYPFKITAAGIMDPALHEDSKTASWKIRSEYFPRVPEWLIENPPSRAMLFPNGDVITYGLLGSAMENNKAEVDDESASGCCGGEISELLCRYNNSGELQITSNLGWWYLYYDLALNDRPQGEIHYRADGYVYFTDAETGAINSIYDYDSTKLPTCDLPEARGRHSFLALRPEQLERLYLAQH